MKTLYLDLFSGVSGDMFIGALIDLGVDFQQLERELGKLQLDGYHLHAERKTKAGIAGVWFKVHLEHHHSHAHGASHEHAHHHHGHSHSHGKGHTHTHEESRNFADIQKLISASPLSDWVKQKSVAVFRRVAEAEGKIHGLPPDQVHFHEVGAVDSIVDIVGACIALELLGRPSVQASAVVDGTGWVDCAHGRLPVPAPATLEILGARGIPLTQCSETHELVTPTGAALVAEFVTDFAPLTGFIAERIGYGLGTRDNRSRPNVLRAALGEISAAGQGTQPHDWELDTVTVLETNLDDTSGEILGHVITRALAEGALDVFYTPVHMKKNRPGVMLTVLCASPDADKLTELLLRETGTFGVRRHTAERRKLRREFTSVQTAFGEVTVKVGELDGEIVHATPEFDSCQKLAALAGVPVKQVYEAAIRAIKL